MITIILWIFLGALIGAILGAVIALIVGIPFVIVAGWLMDKWDGIR